MALLVSLMRGMECTCPAVLPLCHIGSTANEMTGANVILRPHRRKENQCVMNRQQSTSIPGKPHPENHKGAAARSAGDWTLDHLRDRSTLFHELSHGLRFD